MTLRPGFGQDFDNEVYGDDGISRSAEPDEQEAAPGAAPLPPVERELGFILDEADPEKVARHVVQLRTEQMPAMGRRFAVWKRNRWWREGRRWVRLEKKENQNLWEAKLPYGMSSAPPVPNKTDRLCRRLANTILVDPPYPDCEPGDDSNEARDAAEFATRYLSVKGAPAELNMKRLCRGAFDKAETYASGFAWVTMDPGAGGHRPRTMLAHPMATHQDNALEDPTAGEALGVPGLTLPADESDLTSRYVRPDGYLSDDESDADLQWLPAPSVRLLTGHQLLFLPETARGLDDADGVLITDVTNLGDVRKLFPDALAQMAPDEIAALCAWRPDRLEDILPPYTKVPADQKYEDGPKAGQFKDAQMVIVMTVYYESCAAYPMGCYAVIGGDQFVLHKQPWTAQMECPPEADGTECPPTTECLEIPVAQCRCLDDDTTDDPYGVGIVEHLGPADEIAASALGFEIEYMFRAANPHTFLPHGSIVQPKQLALRDNRPIFVNPNGKPEVEQVPPLSATIPELRAEMQRDQDDATGLQQAAQGVEDPSVQSGIHAQVIVQEALKAVSNMKDNIGDFYIAVNRIILQQVRAFCTVPQLISYIGDDGAYKEREWSRADFRTTKRVSIAKGSFTMHTLVAKQQMANDMRAAGAIDMEDYVELVAGGVSPVLGMQDNPHLLRVRRQIETWLKGPGQDWLTAKATVDQQNQQAQQTFATQQQQYAEAQQVAASGTIPGTTPTLGPDGTPVAPAPVQLAPPPTAPPTIPDPPGPFDPRLPIDLEPLAAKIRHRQLSRTMASGRYEALTTKYPAWAACYLAEFDAMKNAAGIMTVPDVQAAKAAEAASQAPGLPRGVTIAMKGDASSVAAEEQAAIAGLQGGGAPGSAPAPAPPPAPPVINIHHHPPVPHATQSELVRDEHGRVIGARHVPVTPAIVPPVPAAGTPAGIPA